MAVAAMSAGDGLGDAISRDYVLQWLFDDVLAQLRLAGGRKWVAQVGLWLVWRKQGVATSMTGSNLTEPSSGSAVSDRSVIVRPHPVSSSLYS